MKVLLWACLALTLCSTQAHSSEPITLSVGDGRNVAVPALPGFYALGTSVPGYRKYIEDREAPNRQLLEVFLTKNDFESVAAGNSPSRERTLTMELMQSGAQVRVSQEQFDAAAASVRAMNQASVDTAFEASLKALTDQMRSRGIEPDVRPSKPKFLGKIRNEADAVAVAERLTTTKNTGTEDIVVVQAYILIRERILALTVNATVHGQADIDWAKRTTNQLITDIQRMNAD